MEKELQMLRVCRDPHHDQAIEWGWNGGKLYQRMYGTKKWHLVKRVGVTPARVKMLNWLINGPEG